MVPGVVGEIVQGGQDDGGDNEGIIGEEILPMNPRLRQPNACLQPPERTAVYCESAVRHCCVALSLNSDPQDFDVGLSRCEP